MQAIILAAGMGKRLKDLTKDNTKCMISINGETLIERVLRQLDELGLSRIILVVGYKSENLVSYVQTLSCSTPIQFVENTVYDKTNNIYSLYLAKEYLLEQDTLLLESDLIIEDGILQRLASDAYPNLVLVAKYESWMDGTVVTLDEQNQITGFLDKNQFQFCDTKNYYKTVNIYRFSKSFSSSHYVPFLEAYCKALGNNEYYEQVLKVIALLENPGIKALILERENWYEIDDIQDLDIAQTLFEPDPATRFKKLNSRYGGFWRFPRLVDFCYLVNPYFPPQKLIEEMQASFPVLLSQYPSGLGVNNLLAANYYGLQKEHVAVGNGAAELIKAFIDIAQGPIGLISPSFDEYRNRATSIKVEIFTVDSKDFSYSADQVMDYFEGKGLSVLMLVNPDNPTGSYIPYFDLLRLAQWTKERNIQFVVDESFCDFVDLPGPVSLMDRAVLQQYPNLVVIKSISKSFGVPGVRLGILSTSDEVTLQRLTKEVSIWNINSFGEFFMQIWGKYRTQYENALVLLKHIREKMEHELQQIPYLTVFHSQANYIMCELEQGFSSHDLAVYLLDRHNLLIKDLSEKRGIAPRQCIRLAVRNEEDNDLLIRALHQFP
ncbi:aminotransferase class I/II-fold pyridoxal phosphate-dependent enzyme [Sphaerochaeta sp.]|uniref:aminotransferase class I/II-fold pyridoxal phosphate-dependent enzyme n=1 Tax=Sphaerochaeta sp. TaxID=1972642 RepID=UPI002FC7314B